MMFITLYLALPAAVIVRAAPRNGLYAPAQTAHPPGAGHKGADRNPAQPEQFADSGELSHALDDCRRQLVISQQQEGDLRLRCSSLAEMASSLEVALMKATEFANFDQLTGLPNRRLLRDRVTRASARAKRRRRGLALLFLDIEDAVTALQKIRAQTCPAVRGLAASTIGVRESGYGSCA